MRGQSLQAPEMIERDSARKLSCGQGMEGSVNI